MFTSYVYYRTRTYIWYSLQSYSLPYKWPYDADTFEELLLRQIFMTSVLVSKVGKQYN